MNKTGCIVFSIFGSIFCFLCFLVIKYVIIGVTLSPSERKWQPYKIGDELFFESNLGQIKSILITDIISKKDAPLNALAMGIKEKHIVFAQTNLIKAPETNSFKYDKNSHYQHNTIWLIVDAYDYFTVGKNGASINYFGRKNRLKTIEHYIKSEKTVTTKNLYSFNDSGNFQKISIDFGIINYREENVEWKLIKFNRDKNTIFHLKDTLNN